MLTRPGHRDTRVRGAVSIEQSGPDKRESRISDIAITTTFLVLGVFGNRMIVLFLGSETKNVALVWGKVARSGRLAHHRHIPSCPMVLKCVLYETKFQCKHARHHVCRACAPCHQLVSVKLGYGVPAGAEIFSLPRTTRKNFLKCQHLNRNGERHRVQPCEGLAIAAQNSNRLMQKRFLHGFDWWIGYCRTQPQRTVCVETPCKGASGIVYRVCRENSKPRASGILLAASGNSAPGFSLHSQLRG